MVSEGDSEEEWLSKASSQNAHLKKKKRERENLDSGYIPRKYLYVLK